MATKRNPDLTRETLLKAAFDEFYVHGFQAASLDRIIEHVGVTKGALYHHFPSKKALGYAVVDEVIRPRHIEEWIQPLQSTDDPIAVMVDAMQHRLETLDPESITCGCPLNNLAMEMSPLDEGFRERTASLFVLWKNAIAQALARGQGAGTVVDKISPARTASFIVAAMEGSISLAKNAQSMDVLREQMGAMRDFLDSIHVSKVVS